MLNPIERLLNRLRPYRKGVRIELKFDDKVAWERFKKDYKMKLKPVGKRPADCTFFYMAGSMFEEPLKISGFRAEVMGPTERNPDFDDKAAEKDCKMRHNEMERGKIGALLLKAWELGLLKPDDESMKKAEDALGLSWKWAVEHYKPEDGSKKE